MITSDRDVFLAAHVTLADKEALRDEAKKRNKSMSALVSELIHAWLTKVRGEVPKLPGNPNEEDVPLPFGEQRETTDSDLHGA